MNLKDKIANIDLAKIKDDVLKVASDANEMAKETADKTAVVAKDIMDKTNKMVEKATDEIVNNIDQNGDGKFDFEDIKNVASVAVDTIKQKSDEAIVAIGEAKKEFDFENLKPIFKKDVLNSSFKLTKFICVTNPDSKHAKNAICEGSIGHYIKAKNDLVINIYKDSLDYFNIELYPDDDAEFYFVDPIEKNRYIDINVYFDYLKEAKVAELTKVVQELGATSFRLSYKEERVDKNKTKMGMKANMNKMGKADANREHNQEELTTVSIGTWVEFKGQDPVKPVLKYLKHVPCIENIVETRMHKNSPSKYYELDFKLHETSSMKEKDALTVDATLKGMKASGDCNYVNELKSELRKHLVCEVKFD